MSERQHWNVVLDELYLLHTASQANFIYFDSKKPYEEVAAAFKKKGIGIARAFLLYNTCVRVTIGLPEKNRKAQQILQ